MNGQVQKIKTEQKLTHQQLMLMRLLHLPITSLEQAIKEEIEKNPLLEELESHDAPTETLGTTFENETQEADSGKDDPFELLNREEYDDDYDTREWQPSDKNATEREWVVSNENSFSEKLLTQLRILPLDDRQMLIGETIISCINDSGYINCDLGLIANDMADYGLEVDPPEVESVLKIIQTFEPAGIGCRNLQECLSIQLHRMEPTDPVVALSTILIDKYFADFSNRRYPSIINSLHVEKEQLNEAIDFIQKLNPKPGSDYTESSYSAQYIVPDFIVTRTGDELSLTLNERYLPQLKISNYYLDMLSHLNNRKEIKHGDKETIRFIKEKAESAQTFIDTLQQRHQTLTRVMEFLLEKQKTFFLSGDNGDIKPLLQKEVAQATALDISTISRIVNEKYVQTDLGTFQLKRLFSKSITSETGEEIATEKIKKQLTDIIENEDKEKPLTDEELTQMLRNQGYNLARRTVAKYREALGYAVGRLRKELKTVIILIVSTLFQLNLCQAQQDNGHNNNGREIADEDELIDQIYLEETPAAIWYGNSLSSDRVRLKTLPLDSLPDEINIRLVETPEQFCFPVKNVITSPYGWRWERPHRGVDIRLKVGDPVHCVFDGIVRIAKPFGAYGNLVVVRHNNGLETVYGHLSKIHVKAKQKVKAGEVLGLGGSTGRSTGPHLHFEVRFQYEAFDPEWILDFSNYTLRSKKLHLDKSYFGITKPKKAQNIVYKADESYIKERPSSPKKTKKHTVYETQRGDTLALISRAYKTTPEKIKELNPVLGTISHNDKLKPGIKIIIL